MDLLLADFLIRQPLVDMQIERRVIMRVEALRTDSIKGFIGFCKRHRSEVDESFLCDTDLDHLTINDENPTYVITDDKDNVVAAASLIINEYYRRGKRARFRIFYSEINNTKYYEALLQALLKHCMELSKLFVYIKTDNDALMETFRRLGFTIERYSYVLIRDNDNIPQAALPEGFSIRAFVEDQDEEVWRDIRNVAFATLQGSETPITTKHVKKMLQEDEYIDEGMKILHHLDKPIGIVRGADDIEEGEPILYIGPLALLPDYQGRGLGRNLLREIMHFGKNIGYKKSILNVNAENENANRLYVSEGFTQVEAVACFIHKL